MLPLFGVFCSKVDEESTPFLLHKPILPVFLRRGRVCKARALIWGELCHYLPSSASVSQPRSSQVQLKNPWSLHPYSKGSQRCREWYQIQSHLLSHASQMPVLHRSCCYTSLWGMLEEEVTATVFVENVRRNIVFLKEEDSLSRNENKSEWLIFTHWT